MTTFRSNAAVLLMLLVTGCAKNMPPANTDLGRIARIRDVRETDRALAAYAQKRVADRPRLSASLIGAGFSRSIDQRCEIYHWTGKNWGDAFAKSMVVSVCGDCVEANAGYLAP